MIPLTGNCQNLHTIHHLGMWVIILFVIIHVYAAIREDIMSRQSMISHHGQRLSAVPDDRRVTIDAARPVLVLGIGNILWADEGFGVRCGGGISPPLGASPTMFCVLDGGTQGLYLVNYVQAADDLSSCSTRSTTASSPAP